jgi:hypothetical protein
MAVATATAATAMGASVNLTTAGSSGTLNNALFQSAGTNVTTANQTLTPFLRFNANAATVQGYNSSGRPLRFNEDSSGPFTRNIQLSDLTAVNVNGTSYYEFFLNVNEPGATTQNTVSLDQLNIYTGPTGSMTTNALGLLGTRRFQLDEGANNWVVIRDMNTAANTVDARILIPTANFAGASQSDFVYLFARMGDFANAQGGFEEFSIITNGVVIPLPTTAGLGMLGLAGLALRRRR